MAYNAGVQPESVYPNDEQLKNYDDRRRRNAGVWGIVFMLCMLVGVVALMALLVSIVNDSFGWVAVVNAVEPEVIVAEAVTAEMLAADHTVTSEDDEVLAAGVASDPNAIGFFGYAYYAEHANELTLAAIDGVQPSASTVESGEYLLSRPLLLYTTSRIMQEKPQVAAFIDYYLNNVNDLIDEVGYFPASASMFAADADEFSAATRKVDMTQGMSGTVVTAGSSTVAPLTTAVAQSFAASGFTGDVEVESIGTNAGFDSFCLEQTSDIANASRGMTRAELEACKKEKRQPVEFRVGSDGVAVVINPANDWATNLTAAQLQAAFTTAGTWSDVDPSWPDQPILRFIPGADSGTLDFFAMQVFDTPISALPDEALRAVLTANVSKGRLRALEAQAPLAERSQAELQDLVVEEVVQPEIVDSWSLFESLLHKDEVETEIAGIPGATMEWRNWVSWDFVTSAQSSNPAVAGVRTAIIGSLWVVLICILFALPLGVGAAIYLEEYSDPKKWYNQLIDTNINNLAGVPSIIYGLLGLAVFVRFLEPITSGSLFGVSDPTTANGRTIISAGLTLGLLILPLIIINAREAIRAVPSSLREASYGIGATRWQTVWNHVLPNSVTGILTGTILAVSRAIGETAPLVLVGATTFITVDPSSPFSKFTTLPTQIYQWTARPQLEFQRLAAAASIVLLVLLILLNATAIYLRNRYRTQRV